jgi:hypothetical protein
MKIFHHKFLAALALALLTACASTGNSTRQSRSRFEREWCRVHNVKYVAGPNERAEEIGSAVADVLAFPFLAAGVVVTPVAYALGSLGAGMPPGGLSAPSRRTR